MRILSTGFAFCLVLGLGGGPAAAQDRLPRQSDAAPPTAETPPPGAAPRVLTAPAAESVAPDVLRAQPAANPSARFQFVRVGDTVLKLDGDSGAVGICQASGSEWNCRALPEQSVTSEREVIRLGRQVERLDGAVDSIKGDVPALRGEIGAFKAGIAAAQDERAALKDDIGALRENVGALKSEIDALRSEIAAVKLALPPPPPPPSERPSVELKMPTAQDYERARALAVDAVSDAWRKLVDMIAQVQSDVMRKG